MALQVQVSGAPIGKSVGSGSSWPAKNSTVFCIMGEQRREKSVVMRLVMKKEDRIQKGLLCPSLETAGPVVGEVMVVDKDSFWPLVNAAGNKVWSLQAHGF